MNFSQLLLVGLIAALLVIGGVFFITNKAEAPKSVETFEKDSQDASSENAGNASGNVSIDTSQASLVGPLGQTGNYTCTFFSIQESGSRNEGTLYVSNAKMRTDFRVINAATGVMTDTHVIRTNGYTYTWVDGTLSGFKRSAQSTNIPRAIAQSIGFAESETARFSWDCHPWIPDIAKLTPPKEITFTAN